MAISTTATWQRTRDQVIRVGYWLCGEIGAGEQPDSDQIAMAAELLQSLLLSLHNEGVALQMIERYSQSLTGVTTTTPYFTAPSDTEEVLDGAIVTDVNSTDTPVELYDRTQYQALSYKTLEGGPPLYYFPEKTTSDTIRVYLYPVPTSDYTTFVYPRARRFRDTDTGALNLDIPRRWAQALEFGMAWKLSVHFKRSDVLAQEERWLAQKDQVLAAETPQGKMSFTLEPLFGR